MGGSSSSPRKITIENPDENVIKITDTVVERLQSASERGSGKRGSLEKPSYDSNASSGADSAFLTSQQIKREVNNEIEKNNARWEHRLKVLREGYREINAELEAEYNKAVKDVNQSLGKQYVSSDLPNTCKESQTSVVECYNLNRDQPLLCSKEVQKFNDCVSSRMNTMLKVK